MMGINDINVLEEMRRAASVPRRNSEEAGRLADQLLKFRDRLQFNDPEWFHQLTQHIATLDSASTFVPQDNEQANQLGVVTQAAREGALRLIDAMLAR